MEGKEFISKKNIEINTSIKNVNVKPDKKLVIYDLIFLQISNLIQDIRVVFPRDIVFKVLQDNLPCFHKNKVEGIQYMKNNISSEIKNLIINKNELLFDPDNKSLRNIKFKRSEYVFSKIRTIWTKLDSNHRIVIWKYLNFILKLLEKV
jgi:hypothetical protein